LQAIEIGETEHEAMPTRGAIPCGVPSMGLNALAIGASRILEKVSAVYSDYAWHYVGMLTDDHPATPPCPHRAPQIPT
jgi:hypothetical protein